MEIKAEFLVWMAGNGIEYKFRDNVITQIVKVLGRNIFNLDQSAKLSELNNLFSKNDFEYLTKLLTIYYSQENCIK